MKTWKRIGFTRLVWMLLISFLIVFIARWAYEIYFSGHDVTFYYNNLDYTDAQLSFERTTSNIASEKVSQKDLSGQDITLDQKYEKTANISSVSGDFSEDIKNLKDAVTKNEAVIQSENLNGLEGSQALFMAIGVKPENFDSLVEELKGIGILTSFGSIKEDKTEEFRELMAEQAILEKTRDSYVEIKKNGGSIQDLLKIEEKILEVEAELQTLAVNSGLFSTENSLCTVNFSLNEQYVEKNDISLRFILRCAKTSFFFTVSLFLGVLFFSALLLVSLWIVVLLFDNVKKFITNRRESESENNTRNDEKRED